MSQNINNNNDFENKMEELDEAIVTHNKIIGKLKTQRLELFSEKLDLEMTEIIECAIENDISPRRMMDLIKAEIEERQSQFAV